MKTSALFLPLLVTLATACAQTQADRPPPRTAEDEAARPEPGATAGAAGTEQATAPSLTVTGVYLEPSLASTCGIPVPPTTFFEFDSATLDTSETPVLRSVAVCLTTGPLRGRRVEVVGHADPRGTDEYNKQLGRSRAESVTDYLVKQGVSSTDIVTRSAGEEAAAASPPGQWPLERRVEILLIPE